MNLFLQICLCLSLAVLVSSQSYMLRAIPRSVATNYIQSRRSSLVDASPFPDFGAHQPLIVAGDLDTPDFYNPYEHLADVDYLYGHPGLGGGLGGHRGLAMAPYPYVDPDNVGYIVG